MKRLTAILLCMIFIMAVPVMASDEPLEEEDPVIEEMQAEETKAESEEVSVGDPEEALTDGAASGSNGENVTWSLSDDGVLTISGTGALRSLSFDEMRYGWTPYNTAVKSIVISEGITEIGSYAFQNFTVETVSFPSSLVSIGRGAFGYTDLTSVQYAGTDVQWQTVTIGDGNEMLHMALQGKLSGVMKAGGTWLLTKDGTLTVELASEGALTADDIPWDPVRYIIKDITLKEGITALEYNAFFSCYNAKTVSLPKSLQSIARNAFNDCLSLTDVYYQGTPEDWTSVTFDRNAADDPLNHAVFHFNDGSSTTAPSDTSSETEIPGDTPRSGTIEETEISWAVDENGTLTITGNGAMPDFEVSAGGKELTVSTPWFPLQSIITGISVEDGITGIGANAFRNLYGVSDVTMADSVTSIGNQAFFGCLELHQITLPKQLQSIGDFAFHWCELQGDLIFPDTIKTIGKMAFDGIQSETLDLPEGLAYIGEGAFGANESIKELTIRSVDLALDSEGSAFSTLYALQTVHIAEGVKTIPPRCFSHCWALNTIELPSTIEALGHDFIILKDIAYPEEDSLSALEHITVAPREGYTLFGWVDDNGDIYTTEELLARPRPAYTGDLYPKWIRNWSDDLFKDVKSGDWFYDAVRTAYQYELMVGMSEDTFAPQGAGTRAQVVTILWRLMGEPAPAGSGSFSDVPGGQWYSDAVAWAAENGITNGYEDGTFRPLRNVTRQEFVKFLLNMAVYLDIASTDDPWEDQSLDRFSDASDIAAWALPAERWSVGVGLQNGSADGDGKLLLAPNRTVSRAELAAFLVNFATGQEDILEKDIEHYKSVFPDQSDDSADKKTVAAGLVGAAVEDLYAAIGDPKSVSYEESCLVLGAEDGVLEYEGFSVQTLRYPNGTELVVDVF